jgi:methyl-accepting chemotaxis protein
MVEAAQSFIRKEQTKAGTGFAVVASEVRTLAQRFASAAKEIKGLIEASVDQVDAGSMLVNQAGKTMADIVDSVRRVKSTRTLKGRHASSGTEATTVSERRSLPKIQAGKDGDWEEF